MKEGFDAQLDTIGVILEETFYCGNCNVKMEKVGPKRHRCSKCSQVYEGG